VLSSGFEKRPLIAVAARCGCGQCEFVDEVVLDGEDGRSLTLRRTAKADDESFWAYEATLRFPGGEGTTQVQDYGMHLAPFIRSLADAWKGFEGTQAYASLEGQLELSCEHDGMGTVSCAVTLRQPSPLEWSVEAVVRFGAGAHLERIAADIEAFVGAARDIGSG
jgi:hypothetical protein